MNIKTTRRGFVAATASLFSPEVTARAAGNQPAEGSRMILAFRLSTAQWTGDAQFRKVIELLSAHRAAVDEVWLFDTGFIRPGTSIGAMTGVAPDTMARRLAQLKQAGFRAGINVFWTLGHQNLNMPGPAMPFQPMIGHDGSVADSCACPNDPAYREYVRRKYRAAALAKPDFICVDDDFRMCNHGPSYPCFCPICLKKFGHGLDRQALVRQLNQPDAGELRRAWSEFCAASLESLAAGIGRAVRETDPNIEIGLMTIGYSLSTYAGYPFPRCMRALGARRGRPGHGFYYDAGPRALLNKTMDVSRQVRDYPPEVKTIQYEVENYPYIELDKAAQTVLNECTLALMAGSNGIAFNVLKECAGTLDDYAPLVRAIAAGRPVWESLERAMRGLPLAGLWPADTPDLMAARTVDESGWFQEGGLFDIQQPNDLLTIGIPLIPDRRQACGVVLAGKVADGFPAAELRTMLSGGVLMDNVALDVLWARGLGELAGVRTTGDTLRSVTERFTAHPLNGRDAGDGRDALVGAADRVFSLAPVAPGAESLSTLVRYDGKELGSCFSVFTNKLGGRIAVASYSPWRRLGRGSKRRQLLAVADWLTGSKLPVRIDQTVRVVPFLRVDAEGRRLVLVLFNAALDPSGPLTVRLRANPAGLRLVDARGSRPLPLRQTGGGCVVEVPSIDAWHTAILTSV